LGIHEFLKALIVATFDLSTPLHTRKHHFILIESHGLNFPSGWINVRTRFDLALSSRTGHGSSQVFEMLPAFS
jgi:hypothetical protein